MENKTGQKQIELKKRILVRNLCSAARFKNYCENVESASCLKLFSLFS